MWLEVGLEEVDNISSNIGVVHFNDHVRVTNTIVLFKELNHIANFLPCDFVLVDRATIVNTADEEAERSLRDTAKIIELGLLLAEWHPVVVGVLLEAIFGGVLGIVLKGLEWDVCETRSPTNGHEILNALHADDVAHLDSCLIPGWSTDLKDICSIENANACKVESCEERLVWDSARSHLYHFVNLVLEEVIVLRYGYVDLSGSH